MAENPHFPLRWPPGWPRTAPNDRQKSSRFKVGSDKTRREIKDELAKLGGADPIVSSNVATRGDGTPYADAARRRIEDPGVALYFTMHGKQMVMARDSFERPEDNLRDIGLAIRDMRSLELHGGSTMLSRAFEGFAALPPPDSCWKILGIDRQPKEVMDTRRGVGVAPHPSRANIMDAFRERARDVSSGNGGDMDRLVKARDAALKEIG